MNLQCTPTNLEMSRYLPVNATTGIYEYLPGYLPINTTGKYWGGIYGPNLVIVWGFLTPRNMAVVCILWYFIFRGRPLDSSIYGFCADSMTHHFHIKFTHSESTSQQIFSLFLAVHILVFV